MVRQFGRYVAIQLMAYVLDMGSFLVLIGNIGDHPVWANIASKIVAGTFAFFGHRRFTFVLGTRTAPSEVAKYVLLVLANIPMTSLVLVALLYWTDVVALAKFFADVSCVGITFLLAKFVVFTRTNGGTP